MVDVKVYGIWWGSTNTLNMDFGINRNDKSLSLIIPTLQGINTERKSRERIQETVPQSDSRSQSSKLPSSTITQSHAMDSLKETGLV